MKIQFVRQWSSITESVCEDEVNPLMVITGVNGAGKSHLLEAIENGSLVLEGVQPGPANSIRRFMANQLVAAIESPQMSGNYRDRWADFERTVTSNKQNLLTQGEGLRTDSDELERQLCDTLIQNRQMNAYGIKLLKEKASKRISDLTHNDFMRHAPLLSSIRDPFQLSITEVFLTYHARRNRNNYLQFLESHGKNGIDEPLTDEEFEKSFGVPPWQLLDETLRLIDLDYSFVAPEGLEDDIEYEVSLRHNDTGIEVPAGQLSSGEKTLLVIAMALYSGTRLGDAIELPQAILLDEVDAGLHPSMIKNLLKVIEEVFFAGYGVKVILATHSPTTVALAPIESLYVMRRTPYPRLRHATDRDEALASLTVGLSTLSVKTENKRIVFVESEYDEECYQEMFRILRPRLNQSVSLEFVASGRRGQGNSIAVEYLVSKMREGGNENTWGILDRDARTQAPRGIVFNPERYSIENVALDPLVLAVMLLREKLILSESLGLSAGAKWTELGQDQAQAMTDALTNLVAQPSDDLTRIQVEYLGGFTTEVPAFWLNAQGHALEQRVVDTFPGLRRFNRNLKWDIISRIFEDAEHFVPKSVVALFQSIVG